MTRIANCGYAALLLTTAAFAESKLKLEELPTPVQKTVKEQTSNATIVGIAKEKEGGKTLYEVETKVDGKARDFEVDPMGKLVVVEQEVALDSLPAAARTAIEKKTGGCKISRIETVTQGTAVSYEAAYVTKAGKKAEYGVNADGSAHK